MSKTSIGRHSPSKAMAYEAIQQTKEKPDYQMTGGPLDTYYAKWNKNKKQMIQILESTLNDDHINDQVDSVLAWFEQREKQSPDYELLGLTNHKGQLLKKDVRNAYRRQARKLHPDVGGTDEAFQELHAAYRRVLASVPKE